MGDSYSHTWQVEATSELFDGFTMTATYRRTNVKSTYGGVLREKPLTNKYMDFAVIQQFAHGGMSSGGVDNQWWMQTGIPLLKKRLTGF